jgi:hypothetical protein
MVGKHVAFRGDLLHGAPQELGVVSGPGKVGCGLGDRVVVVVNVWLRAAPWSVPAFPATAVPLLHDVNVGVFLSSKVDGLRQGGLTATCKDDQRIDALIGTEVIHVSNDANLSTRVVLSSTSSDLSGDDGRIHVTIPNWLLTDQNTSSISLELVFSQGAELRVQ